MFFFRRRRRRVAASTSGRTQPVSSVQRVLSALSTDVTHMPFDIQTSRIATAIRAIAIYKNPAYHPKMRAADVLELKLLHARLLRLRLPPRDINFCESHARTTVAVNA